jgi:hypothetical protein
LQQRTDGSSGPTTNQALVPPTGSHPPLKRQGSPLPQHKDDTPVFHSSNDSRTRNRYPANRLSRHINSLVGHTSPLAGGRAPFRLRHDDCLKKSAPHCFSLFPFFLSPLSPQGSGKEIFQKSPSQQRKRAPSPPTDLGFEVCALRGSATTPEHSGSEPSTDQGFEGWPLGRVRQPPQSMQSQG